jgi:hypothetical protein
MPGVATAKDDVVARLRGHRRARARTVGHPRRVKPGCRLRSSSIGI